jgi:hypothetical protein
MSDPASTSSQDLLDKYFGQTLNEIKAKSGNTIFVLKGASENFWNSLNKDWLADANLEIETNPSSFYDQKWFTEVFSELVKEKPCHILGFAQFTHLIEYIDPSFFKALPKRRLSIAL